MTDFSPTVLSGQATSTLMNAAGGVQGQLQGAAKSLNGAAGQLASQAPAIQRELGTQLAPAQSQLASAMSDFKNFDTKNITGLTSSAPISTNGLMGSLPGTPGEKIQQFTKMARSGGVPGVNVASVPIAPPVLSGRLSFPAIPNTQAPKLPSLPALPSVPTLPSLALSIL